MFLGKKARSLKTLKTLPLAIFVVAAGILGLVWLGADAVEAGGRSITLTRNELTIPDAAFANTAALGDASCALHSLVEWEPLGSRVEVQFSLQEWSKDHWKFIASDIQPLPGKATSASVDWGQATSGSQYRHIFRLYSVKGKDGATRNHQLVSELSTPLVANCG